MRKDCVKKKTLASTILRKDFRLSQSFDQIALGNKRASGESYSQIFFQLKNAQLQLLIAHCSTTPPASNTATHAPPPISSIKGSLHPSLFTPFQDIPISFKSLFMTSSQPRRGRPAFRVAPDGWPKRTIFGNLSSFVCRTWPSHLNLSFIISLDSGIEPHFSYKLLFEIRSVSRVPRTIRTQFLWKTSSKCLSTFRRAHASEPYLNTVITGLLLLTLDLLICVRMCPPPMF